MSVVVGREEGGIVGEGGCFPREVYGGGINFFLVGDVEGGCACGGFKEGGIIF